MLNTPKMGHRRSGGTLRKWATGIGREPSENGLRNTPKIGHGDHSENGLRRKIKITKNNNSDPAASPNAVVVVAGGGEGIVSRLREVGFSTRVAAQLARSHSPATIERQLKAFPLRTADRNALGPLRASIEEDWAEPSVKKLSTSITPPRRSSPPQEAQPARQPSARAAHERLFESDYRGYLRDAELRLRTKAPDAFAEFEAARALERRRLESLGIGEKLADVLAFFDGDQSGRS